MKNNLIQWPTAKYWTATFNPYVGCRKVSPACEHCYAEAMCARFGMNGADGFAPTPKPNAKMPRKGVVFCGNMTDLFGEWVSDLEICEWLNLICHSERGGVCVPNGATYLWLTKRVSRMCNAIGQCGLDTEWAGGYFGFTAECQKWYDLRIPHFRDGWGYANKNGWLSAEPLLGPIDLGLYYIAPEDQPFQWVVVGCESGPNRRPCKLEWVESIVEECRAANVPVFVKQLDLGGKCETDINKFPAHLQIRQVPWATEIADNKKGKQK